jgi:hypothetical protein
VASLESEVEVLKEELDHLRAELNRLRAKFGAASRASSALDSPGLRRVAETDSHSEGGHSGFSLVGSEASGASHSSHIISAGVPTSGYQGTSSAKSLSWPEREAICADIGSWLAKSLRGGHRGPSGRDRIPLGSRVWLVARDFTGTVFDPVRVCHNFTDCKALVKRGSDTGESIFIGVPSEREAKLVVARAHLSWPCGDY